MLKTMELEFWGIEGLKKAKTVLEHCVFDIYVCEDDMTITAVDTERKLKFSKSKLAREGVPFKGGRVC